MTIGRDILGMSPEDLGEFILARQKSRATHEWKVGKRVKTLSVASIAKMLGVSKAAALEEIKKQLSLDKPVKED